MLSRSLFLAVPFALILATGATAQAEERKADNSGRKLAVIIPLPPSPSPVAVRPIAIPHTAKGGVSSSYVPPGSALNDRPGAFRARRLSSVSTPIKLSPETKAALNQGARAATGLSKIAIKRVSDIGAWVGVLWNQMNDARLTPASPVLGPDISNADMGPIPEPGRSVSKMYFTNERRIKTVTGR